MPEVPAGGLVVTDLLVGDGLSNVAALVEATLQGDPIEQKFQFRSQSLTSYNFQSGIPFNEGTSVLVSYDAKWPLTITISGYIPGTARGEVPAISGLGLGIMLLFIVAVGGFVFKRVRLQEV